MIIWDYDSAIGQINSSLPYNFLYVPIFQEIENVDYILEIAKTFGIKMTFACLGFAAEPGTYPFNISDQIKKIYNEGHEIASHSWKHEWFPYLTEEQIYKSLERSKYALEKCVGKNEIVRGFVPPHSRPMSWYKKLSFSMGDRAIYPIHKGGDLGYILKQLSKLNYTWCRVLKSYRPVWSKFFNHQTTNLILNKWEIQSKIVCVPQHYTGFDEGAIEYLERCVEKNEALVIVGHPAALSRNGPESKLHFNNFIDRVKKYKADGNLVVSCVNEYIDNNILTGVKN